MLKSLVPGPSGRSIVRGCYITNKHKYIYIYTKKGFEVITSSVLQRTIPNIRVRAIYVCMVITDCKVKDQPGKFANSARGRLNRENEYLAVPVHVSSRYKEGSAPRDGVDCLRSTLLCSLGYTLTRSECAITHEIATNRAYTIAFVLRASLFFRVSRWR